jgi:hypothetical protein
MNVLPRALQLSVLHHLVEGNSLRSITRLTKVNRTTIMKLMVQAGEYLLKFLDARMRGLVLKHVQCDELWTFVQKKEGHKRDDEQSNDTIGDMFLFVAIDQLTKLVPSWTLGKRNGPVTERFMKDSPLGS